MADSTTPGAMMSYREFGEGAPVVLLHAFPLDGRMFEPQAEALAGRLITPDFPGFGRSPRAPAQPDMRYYAEGVRWLLDRLDLERVVLQRSSARQAGQGCGGNARSRGSPG